MCRLALDTSESRAFISESDTQPEASIPQLLQQLAWYKIVNHFKQQFVIYFWHLYFYTPLFFLSPGNDTPESFYLHNNFVSKDGLRLTGSKSPI